jgi:DNA-binding CsgD family transcriptional regulator
MSTLDGRNGSQVSAPAAVSELPMIALLERHMGLRFDEVAGKLAKLTNRESQILERIAAGDDTNEIIQNLDISYSTLAGHRKRLAEKLGQNSNGAHAKTYWFHRICGLIQPEVAKPAKVV